MKSFFSWIDVPITTPQPIQHLAIREHARKAGGAAITFYGSEDIKTLKSQSSILEKLRKSRGIDGVVFFSLYQFGYGPSFNFKLMREILRMGLEVHFAREGLSIRDEKALDALFPLLLSVDYVKRRAAGARWKDFLSRV